MDKNEIIQKLFNDTIDMDSVNETIRDTFVRGYRNLYDIQKSMTGLQRFDIPLQEFKSIKRLPMEKQSSQYPMRYIHTIGLDIVSGEKEYQFKVSGLQNIPLTQYEISKNNTIFKNNFIAYLGGKMIATMKYLITDNECSILFELDNGVTPNDYMTGMKRSTFEKMYGDNEVLHLFIVPNYTIDYADKTDFMLSFSAGLLKLEDFKDGSGFKPGKTFIFMNSTTEDAMTDFVRCDVLDTAVTIPKELYNNLGIRRFRIYAITFNILYDIKPITPDDEWFMLGEDYELPVPTSNIIPFVKNDKGYDFDPEITLDAYYPNIYHVNNMNNRDISLFIFYADDTLDSKYTNDLQLLHMVYDDILDKYKNKTLPEAVINYQPVQIELFDMEDYTNSVYFPEGRDVYNINKLQEYISEDPRMLLKYLTLKLLGSPKYFIDVSKIDLSERIRRDTMTECDLVGDRMEFNEDRYLIRLRKKFVGADDMDFRVFIDNLCIRPSRYVFTYNTDFYLFYFPTDMIKPNSVIEFEKYNQIKMYQDVSPVRMDATTTYSSDVIAIGLKDSSINTVPIKITVPEKFKMIDSYNFALIDITDRHFISQSDYRFMIYNDIAEDFIEISTDGHYIIDRDFYLIVTSNHIGENLRLLVDNSTVYLDFDFDEKESTHYSSFIGTGRLRNENVRIFKNGLSLPSSRFFVSENTASGCQADVAVCSECKANDVLAFDIVPIEFRPEFYLKQIDNVKGYVCTEDCLSSYLDLRWYDIYLNGKKLNKNNIEIIACNKFFVKNVDTLKNLYIIKRDGLYDSFSIRHDADISNDLLDKVEDLLDDLKDLKEDIPDTADDIVADAITDLFLHLMFVSKILEFSFINPNKKQLNAAIKSEFPYLFNEYDILNLDTNTNPDAEVVTSINSNIRRQYMKKGQYRYGFTPMHIGNHADAQAGEYMCDPVTGAPGIKTDNGEIISSGILTRLANHKDKMITTLAFNGMSNMSIYQLELNDNTRSVDCIPEQNILDDIVDLDAPVNKMMISLDMDVLEKGADDVMLFSNYDPVISIVYETENNGIDQILDLPLSTLNTVPIKLNGTNVAFKSIGIKQDTNAPSTLKCILYSILMSF